MKILKSIAIVVTAMMIMINLTQPVAEATSFNDMNGSLIKWLNKGKKDGEGLIDEKGIGNILKPIIEILTAIGVIVLVAVTVIMGIKYMFATPEEAAKLKQQLIGLVVSSVVVLGAAAIWKVVYNLLSTSLAN